MIKGRRILLILLFSLGGASFSYGASSPVDRACNQIAKHFQKDLKMRVEMKRGEFQAPDWSKRNGCEVHGHSDSYPDASDPAWQVKKFLTAQGWEYDGSSQADGHCGSSYEMLKGNVSCYVSFQCDGHDGEPGHNEPQSPSRYELKALCSSNHFHLLLKTGATPIATVLEQVAMTRMTKKLPELQKRRPPWPDFLTMPNSPAKPKKSSCPRI